MRQGQKCVLCLKTEKGEYKQCALGRRNQEGFSFFWLSLDDGEVITFQHHRKRCILDKASCQLAAEQDRSGVIHLLEMGGGKISIFPFLGVFASTCVALCHKKQALLPRKISYSVTYCSSWLQQSAKGVNTLGD